jgi:apolipoprotein N-acyltransferase
VKISAAGHFIFSYTGQLCYTAGVRNIHKSAWLLAALSGVLQVLIFPSPGLYFLCWIAYAPLLIALLRTREAEMVGVPDSLAASNYVAATPWQGFLLAWLSGIISVAGTCFWIFHVMHVYGGLDAATSFGILILFCLYIGAQVSLFGLGLAMAASGGRSGKLPALQRALIAAPFLWVAVELLRAKVFGFPWNPLGTVQVNNIPLGRIATVTGVYGMSFEIMLVNSAFAAAFLVKRRQRRLLLLAAVAAALIVQISAIAQPPALAATETARLVQENIPIRDQWTREEFQQTIGLLRQDSIPSQANLMPGEPIPSVVIWPESPAPFFIDDPQFRQAASEIARQSKAYLIAGSIGTNTAPQMRQSNEIYNSAALITPTGEWAARYDKIHLVPFGEYVPFSTIFSFAGKLTKEVGNFVPGTTRNVFDLGTYKAGVFICYESIFPDEVRQFAANGGNVLVNISNDGWFGYYGAPEQHLNQARMRAIENNRWLLRATNTGITVSIDPYGRVVASALRNVRATLDAPFGIVTATTFYTRHGDWFAYLCAIISLVVLALGARAKIPKKPLKSAAL